MTRYKYLRRLVTARKIGLAVYHFLNYFLNALIDHIEYRGRAGHVDFNPPSGDRLYPIDGYVIVRRDGDDYNRTKIYFHATNRWPIRGGRIPSRRYALDIMSQALLSGHNASYVVWGEATLMPYDMEGIEQGFALKSPAYRRTVVRRHLRTVEHQNEIREQLGEPVQHSLAHARVGEWMREPETSIH